MAILTEPPPAETTAGVDFALTEDQELLRDEVRRFAEERIRPGWPSATASTASRWRSSRRWGRWASSA